MVIYCSLFLDTVKEMEQELSDLLNVSKSTFKRHID